jgi:hypothetical protein
MAGTHEMERDAASATSELCAILLAGLEALAEAGEADRACWLAGRACAALRGGEDDRSWRRFNALLHRLAPRTGPVGTGGGAGRAVRAMP